MPARSRILSAHGRTLGATGAVKGGRARAASLTKGERSSIAQVAAHARWAMRDRASKQARKKVSGLRTLSKD